MCNPVQGRVCLAAVSAACLLLYAWPARSQTITTFAGNGSTTFSGDGGLATNASLNHPRGLAIDSTGGVYIADTDNKVVRRVSPSGIITTVAGSNVFFGNANATFSDVYGLALDAAGNLYIADATNRRIRKMTPDGTVSTFAGTGNQGSGGDGGPAANATLNRPIAVALDAAGNLYVCDSGNNNIRRVVLASGIITTYAGNGVPAYSGDGGQATAASLMTPVGVATDKAGNLYIADADNNRIRKVTPGGVITTVAGTGNHAGFAGDGAAATAALLNIPYDVAVDATGSLFIADAGNNRIRRVDGTSGIISTIAGGIRDGFSGDGGPAANSLLSFPWGITIDASGAVYIADRVNSRIRKITGGAAKVTLQPANAASYATASFAPDELVALFGTNLATSTVTGTGSPVVMMGGTTVTIADSAGIKQAAQLLYVSPAQVSFLMPAAAANGSASLVVTNANNVSFSTQIQVTAVAPGLFTMNSTGRGAPAGQILRVHAGGGQDAPKDLAVLDASQNQWLPTPIDLGAETDTIYLLLYGTGLRHYRGTPVCTVGGRQVSVAYAGPQGGFAGLDQINIVLPRSLRGAGTVDLTFAVDGAVSNAVTIAIQ